MLALLSRARSGDQGAEQEMFEHLLCRFRLFARRRIGDVHAAEDVAQDACLTVLQKYQRQTFTKGFEPWAWGVLQMHIKAYCRRRLDDRETLVADPPDQTPAGDLDPALERQLLDCLARIAAVNRGYARALVLIYQGHSTEAICARLGIPRNHLYVTLHRARAQLRKCLDGGGR